MINNEYLLLIRKHSYTLIEQTKKIRSQEVLEYFLNKQWEFFSFCPPMNLSEEEKWLIAATTSETTN